MARMKTKPNSRGWYWQFFAGIVHGLLLLVIFLLTMGTLVRGPALWVLTGLPIIFILGTTFFGHWSHLVELQKKAYPERG